ncbi:hypothetical protein Desti_0724 [Desulfomonile tiedjei DSM 6799]|uniref:Uncharacterized protein n=1 Tax=Desulfomonile tiedjei (strain ATCC 49306 / DSM 6799 / DCB-1) TaxID=706587 RepID=I4C1K9_DESTA|nr:hypothetical protein Desti_0724 [Desulfomonile tiedjei DSM 6799]
MYRLAVLFGIVILSFASIAPGFCQGIPGRYPQPFPTINSCVPSRPAPSVSRTIQVDVPVPCAPLPCGPTMACPLNPCGPPVCGAPPCAPSQPVQVRVDVVVRPENPQLCVPQRFCCENPPIFEPFFCKAAGLIQSLIVAPLSIGERFMGHPVPAPLPPATPIPCCHMPVAKCPQPQAATQCMLPCPPPISYASPGLQAKVKPSCKPMPAQGYPSCSPFSR